MATLIDDLRALAHVANYFWMESSDELRERIRNAQNVVDAYDALAPTWDDAPEWARWYALNVNGGSWWFENEPWLEPKMVGVWVQDGGLAPGYRVMKLPTGIDWRLCLWRRPDTEGGE